MWRFLLHTASDSNDNLGGWAGRLARFVHGFLGGEGQGDELPFLHVLLKVGHTASEVVGEVARWNMSFELFVSKKRDS